MSPGGPSRPEGRIIVEFVRNGQWLKCSAVDEVSGIEASAAGPASDPSGVQRLAVAKLKRLLAAAG